jgi:hypothetical protein
MQRACVCVSSSVLVRLPSDVMRQLAYGEGALPFSIVFICLSCPVVHPPRGSGKATRSSHLLLLLVLVSLS